MGGITLTWNRRDPAEKTRSQPSLSWPHCDTDTSRTDSWWTDPATSRDDAEVALYSEVGTFVIYTLAVVVRWHSYRTICSATSNSIDPSTWENCWARGAVQCCTSTVPAHRGGIWARRGSDRPRDSRGTSALGWGSACESPLRLILPWWALGDLKRAQPLPSHRSWSDYKSWRRSDAPEHSPILWWVSRWSCRDQGTWDVVRWGVGCPSGHWWRGEHPSLVRSCSRYHCSCRCCLSYYWSSTDELVDCCRCCCCSVNRLMRHRLRIDWRSHQYRLLLIIKTNVSIDYSLLSKGWYTNLVSTVRQGPCFIEFKNRLFHLGYKI